MKLINILLILTLLTTVSCNHDPVVLEDLNVNFFTSSKYIIDPSEIIADPMNVLLMEAHHEGATFEVVREEVLVKDAQIRILENITEYNFMVDLDQLNNSNEDIICYSFELDTIHVPPQYVTREYFKVLEDGNGNSIEAEYEEINSFLIIKPETVEEIDNQSRSFATYQFRIGDNTSFEEYFVDQIDNSEFTLEEEVNYSIN